MREYALPATGRNLTFLLLTAMFHQPSMINSLAADTKQADRDYPTIPWVIARHHEGLIRHM
jgi:hypothetical protein